jgi:hypothetical protein
MGYKFPADADFVCRKSTAAVPRPEIEDMLCSTEVPMLEAKPALSQTSSWQVA